MIYRKRLAEQKLQQLIRHFKIVLVTGARQVGKTTLLQHGFPEYKLLVFDPLQDLYGAREDPDLFLSNFPPPLLLDEIQFAPQLLPALKRKVDQTENSGQYLLTGSQNLSVLQSVSESLAGRAAILPLEGLSLHETFGQAETGGWLAHYLDDPESLPDLFQGLIAAGQPLNQFLWRGSMPGLLDKPDAIVPDFLNSYIQTYVERDVRLLEQIQQHATFGRFLGLAAAHTAQEINTSEFGREVGVTPATARRWLDLLTQSFQWLELTPYHGRTVKRLTGKRKGYLRDSGLACWLQRLSSPDAVAVSPLFGSLFESWVVNEVHRQFVTLATAPQAYHWRTAAGAEVDLVLERDGKLYPIEIKCKSRLTGQDRRGLKAFRETYPQQEIMPALVIYAGSECYRLDPHTIALPWNATSK